MACRLDNFVRRQRRVDRIVDGVVPGCIDGHIDRTVYHRAYPISGRHSFVDDPRLFCRPRRHLQNHVFESLKPAGHRFCTGTSSTALVSGIASLTAVGVRCILAESGLVATRARIARQLAVAFQSVGQSVNCIKKYEPRVLSRLNSLSYPTWFARFRRSVSLFDFGFDHDVNGVL